MAVLAPVKWYATYDSVLSQSSPTRASFADRVAKQHQLQLLQQAEQNGYFLSVTRDVIISMFIHGPLPKDNSKNYDEVVNKTIRGLRIIRLNNLRVRQLDDIGLCTSLRVLTLHSNFISRIDAIGQCHQLLKLDLHGNQISRLPAADFWQELTELRLLYLHDNPVGSFRSVAGLCKCKQLVLLTLYDTPLSLRSHYRHHLVNTIWSLKALDHYVISDEEIIDGAAFGGRFTAHGAAFRVDPYPVVTSINDELLSVWQILGRINTIMSHHSAVIIIQRFVRGFLVRQALTALADIRLCEHLERAAVTIQRKYRSWKQKARVTPAVNSVVATSRTGLPPRAPTSSPLVSSSVDEDASQRPDTVAAESVKLDYDTYIMNRRPGSATNYSEALVPPRKHKTVNSATKKPALPPNIFIDLHRLGKTLDDSCTQTLSVLPTSQQLQQFFNEFPPSCDIDKSYLGETETDNEDDLLPLSEYRLRGMQPPITTQTMVDAVRMERQRVAECVRTEKNMNHSNALANSNLWLSESRASFAERRAAVNETRARKKQALSGAIWLSCLGAVAEDYKRAELEEKREERREFVRQQKYARQGSREGACSELDRHRTWTMFVDETDRRAITTALQRKERVMHNTFQSYHDARRRSLDFERDRRHEIQFANKVGRHITACAKAHVKFIEREHRESVVRDSSSVISALHEESARRHSAVTRCLEKRRVAIQSRAEIDRDVIDSLISKQVDNRKAETKTRVGSLKQLKQEVAAEKRHVFYLPIISTPGE